jgi:hypothetical protein
MSPDPCGDAFAAAVAAGADPNFVVPDDYVVVRGGTRPWPPPGTTFSAVVGPMLEAAAAAVPHGTIRVSTAGQIRAAGDTITWVPEHSPRGTLNLQHVHITETGPTTFTAPQPSPVPKRQRIDGDKP